MLENYGEVQVRLGPNRVGSEITYKHELIIPKDTKLRARPYDRVFFDHSDKRQPWRGYEFHSQRLLQGSQRPYADRFEHDTMLDILFGNFQFEKDSSLGNLKDVTLKIFPGIEKKRWTIVNSLELGLNESGYVSHPSGFGFILSEKDGLVFPAFTDEFGYLTSFVSGFRVDEKLFEGVQKLGDVTSFDAFRELISPDTPDSDSVRKKYEAIREPRS